MPDARRKSLDQIYQETGASAGAVQKPSPGPPQKSLDEIYLEVHSQPPGSKLTDFPWHDEAKMYPSLAEEPAPPKQAPPDFKRQRMEEGGKAVKAGADILTPEITPQTPMERVELGLKENGQKAGWSDYDLEYAHPDAPPRLAGVGTSGEQYMVPSAGGKLPIFTALGKNAQYRNMPDEDKWKLHTDFFVSELADEKFWELPEERQLEILDNFHAAQEQSSGLDPEAAARLVWPAIQYTTAAGLDLYDRLSGMVPEPIKFLALGPQNYETYLKLTKGGGTFISQDADLQWLAEYNQRAADKSVQELLDEKGDVDVVPGISLKLLAETTGSLGYSGLSMGAAIIGTLAGGPGGGGAAAAVAAYNMDAAQFERTILDTWDAEKLEKTGRHLTYEEQEKILERFKWAVRKHGFHEALWEAVGNVATLGAGKVLVKGLLGAGTKTIAAGVGEMILAQLGEGGGETATKRYQSRAEAEALGTPEMDWKESAKAVIPQTMLLSAMMGTGGVVGGYGQLYMAGQTKAKSQLMYTTDELTRLAEEGRLDEVPDEALDEAESNAVAIAQANPDDPLVQQAAQDVAALGEAKAEEVRAKAEQKNTEHTERVEHLKRMVKEAPTPAMAEDAAVELYATDPEALQKKIDNLETRGDKISAVQSGYLDIYRNARERINTGRTSPEADTGEALVAIVKRQLDSGEIKPGEVEAKARTDEAAQLGVADALLLMAREKQLSNLDGLKKLNPAQVKAREAVTGHIAELRRRLGYDQIGEREVQGGEPLRKEPGGAVQQPRTGTEKAPTGGVLQAGGRPQAIPEIETAKGRKTSARAEKPLGKVSTKTGPKGEYVTSTSRPYRNEKSARAAARKLEEQSAITTRPVERYGGWVLEPVPETEQEIPYGRVYPRKTTARNKQKRLKKRGIDTRPQKVKGGWVLLPAGTRPQAGVQPATRPEAEPQTKAAEERKPPARAETEAATRPEETEKAAPAPPAEATPPSRPGEEEAPGARPEVEERAPAREKTAETASAETEVETPPPSTEAPTARPELSQPEYVNKIIDTSAIKNPDDHDQLGNAGWITDGGDAIGTIHLTDDPSGVISALENDVSVRLGRKEGLYGDLGRGLYASAAPQLWVGRSRAKWDFIKDLDRNERIALAETIIDHPNMTDTGYITESEKDYVRRSLNIFIESGHAETIVDIAGQPYNIRFWKPDFLDKVNQAHGTDIKPGPQPQEIEMKLQGRFAELNRHISDQEAGELQSMGYDGAYIKGGFVAQPQMVVWNNEAIKEFGDFKRGAGSRAEEPSQPPPLPNIETIDTGETGVSYTPRNKPVEFEYSLVELNDLIASNDVNGNINPDYPPELQPRDRSRMASRLQIEQIASNLNPELLGASTKVTDGAPIIGPDGVVESGNGRTLALRLAYSRNQSRDYRQWVETNAPDYGLSRRMAARAQNPVLVRIRRTELDRAEFARQTNQSEMAQMSPSETARSDAARMADEDMMFLAVPESGDMLAPGNRPFVKRFLERMGQEETSGYLTEDGRPTKQLGDRIKAAVFAKSYDDPRLVAAMAEESDPGIKNVLSALSVAAADFARARSLDPGLAGTDIVRHLVEGVQYIVEARAEGMPLDMLLAQGEMFTQRDGNSVKIARFYDANKRSSKRMSEGLSKAARLIYNELSRKNNLELFERTDLGIEELIESIQTSEDNNVQERQAQQAGLFAEEPEGKPPKGPGGGQPAQGGRGRGEPGRERGAETETAVGQSRQPASKPAEETAVTVPTEGVKTEEIAPEKTKPDREKEKGTELFSLASAQSGVTPARRGVSTPDRGISPAVAEKRAVAMLKRLKNFPAVRVVATEAELPGTAQQKAQRPSGIRGMFDPEANLVHVAVSNIANTDELAEVLIHEVIGHYGVETFLSREAGGAGIHPDRAMENFFKEVFGWGRGARSKEMVSVARTYLEGMKDKTDAEIRTELARLKDRDKKVMLGKEWLAARVEDGSINTDNSVRNWYKRFIRALKQALRRMFPTSRIKLSEAEIGAVAFGARREVERGEMPPPGRAAPRGHKGRETLARDETIGGEKASKEQGVKTPGEAEYAAQEKTEPSGDIAGEIAKPETPPARAPEREGQAVRAEERGPSTGQKQAVREIIERFPTDLHGRQELREKLGKDPAFIEWFGASQMTDAQGLPIIFSHGSDSRIETINPLFFRRESLLGPGFYLTADPSVSDSYGPVKHLAAVRLKNPVNMESHISRARADEMIAAAEKHPRVKDFDLNLDRARSFVEASFMFEGAPVTYMDLYNEISAGYLGTKEEVGSRPTGRERETKEFKLWVENARIPGLFGGDYSQDISSLPRFQQWAEDLGFDIEEGMEDLEWDYLNQELGDMGTVLRDVIEDMGHDGILHEGGKATNQKTRHLVAIAFYPDQVLFLHDDGSAGTGEGTKIIPAAGRTPRESYSIKKPDQASVPKRPLQSTEESSEPGQAKKNLAEKKEQIKGLPDGFLIEKTPSGKWLWYAPHVSPTSGDVSSMPIEYLDSKKAAVKAAASHVKARGGVKAYSERLEKEIEEGRNWTPHSRRIKEFREYIDVIKKTIEEDQAKIGTDEEFDLIEEYVGDEDIWNEMSDEEKGVTIEQWHERDLEEAREELRDEEEEHEKALYYDSPEGQAEIANQPVNRARTMIENLLEELGIGYEIKGSQLSDSTYFYVGDVSERAVEESDIQDYHFENEGEGKVIRISDHEEAEQYKGLHEHDYDFVVGENYEGLTSADQLGSLLFYTGRGYNTELNEDQFRKRIKEIAKQAKPSRESFSLKPPGEPSRPGPSPGTARPTAEDIYAWATGEKVPPRAMSPEATSAGLVDPSVIADATAEVAPEDRKNFSDNMARELAESDEAHAQSFFGAVKSMMDPKNFWMRKSGFKPGKDQFNWVDLVLRAPEHFTQKVAPAWRVFKAGMNRSDYKYQHETDVLHGSLDLPDTVPGKLRETDKWEIRATKEGAAPVRQIAWNRDTAAAREAELKGRGYEVKISPAYDLIRIFNSYKKVDKAGFKRLKRLIYESDKTRIPVTEDMLREKGFDERGILAWNAFRKWMNNGLDKFLAEGERTVQALEEAGEELPMVVIEGPNGELMVDLREAMRLMGQLRDTYMPRRRVDKKFVLLAWKDKDEKANPKREHFSTLTFAEARAKELRAQGYTVKKQRLRKVPESVYEDATSVLDYQAVINEALYRMEQKGGEKRESLEDFGVSGEWGASADGQKVFVLSGNLDKKYTEALRSMGGRFYNDKDAPEGSAARKRAWQFVGAGKDIEDRIVKNLQAAGGYHGNPEVIFARALAEMTGEVLHGRGFRGAKISRVDMGGKVWEGYEEDPVKAAVGYTSALAGGLAKKQSAGEMIKAHAGTDVSFEGYKQWKNPEADFAEYMAFVRERRIDPAEQRGVHDAMKSFMTDVLRNDETVQRVFGHIKGFIVMNYLGWRFLSAPAVNFTALGTTAPAAMVNYGGIPARRTPDLIVNGMDKYRRYKWGRVAGVGKLTAEEEWLYGQIEARGWHASQFNREAIIAAQGMFGRGWAGFLNASMWAFGVSEQINRVSTIAGAYKGLKARQRKLGEAGLMADLKKRLAKGPYGELREAYEREGKLTDDMILEVAKHISDMGHGVYGKLTLPHQLRGSGVFQELGRTNYIFQKFNHNYTDNLVRYGYRMSKTADPRAFLMQLALPTVFGGMGAAGGIWLWPWLRPLLGYLLNSDDPEEDMYRYIEEQFGAGAATYARYGLPGLAGISLKGSLEMRPELPRSLLEAVGPIGSFAESLGYGVQFALKGEFKRAAEEVTPTGVAKIIRAFREYGEGVTTWGGGLRYEGIEPIKPDAADTVRRALGFNPSRMGLIMEQQYKEKKISARYKEMRDDIYEMYARRFFIDQPDKERQLEVLMAITAYNNRVAERGAPANRITEQSLHQAMMRRFRAPSKERKAAEAAGAGKFIPSPYPGATVSEARDAVDRMGRGPEKRRAERILARLEDAYDDLQILSSGSGVPPVAGVPAQWNKADGHPYVRRDDPHLTDKARKLRRMGFRVRIVPAGPAGDLLTPQEAAEARRSGRIGWVVVSDAEPSQKRLEGLRARKKREFEQAAADLEKAVGR